MGIRKKNVERLLTKRLREIRQSKKLTLEKLVAEDAAAAFYSGKLASARYFASTLLSQATAKAQAIMRMDKAALEIAENAF